MGSLYAGGMGGGHATTVVTTEQLTRQHVKSSSSRIRCAPSATSPVHHEILSSSITSSPLRWGGPTARKTIERSIGVTIGASAAKLGARI